MSELQLFCFGFPRVRLVAAAVLTQTWEGLSGAEQKVLKKLSVFRGGCLREAAERVAGASLPVLAALIDKSLLRQSRQGRYEMHESIRQFSAEKLHADSRSHEQP